MQNRLHHCSKPFFSEQSWNHLNFPKVNIFFLKKISFFMVEKKSEKTSATAETETSQVFKNAVEEISNVFFNFYFLEPKLTILTNRRSFSKMKNCFFFNLFPLLLVSSLQRQEVTKSKVWTLPWDLIQKSISGSEKNIRGNSLSPKNLFVLDTAVVVASAVVAVVAVVPDVDSTADVVDVDVVVVDVV